MSSEPCHLFRTVKLPGEPLGPLWRFLFCESNVCVFVCVCTYHQLCCYIKPPTCWSLHSCKSHWAPVASGQLPNSTLPRISLLTHLKNTSRVSYMPTHTHTPQGRGACWRCVVHWRGWFSMLYWICMWHLHHSVPSWMHIRHRAGPKKCLKQEDSRINLWWEKPLQLVYCPFWNFSLCLSQLSDNHNKKRHSNQRQTFNNNITNEKTLSVIHILYDKDLFNRAVLEDIKV